MICLAVLCCGFLPVIFGRPIYVEEVVGRSPLDSPAAVTAETALQFLLRNDQDMCLLKLVCVAGANVSRYGSFADSLAHSFGYKYQPFDFSVVKSPNLAEKIVGRNAEDGLDELTTRHLDDSVFIRAPKFDFTQDFTWMVQITPIKSVQPVYVNKPIKVWRPVKWTNEPFRPFPVPIVKPAFPVHEDVPPVEAAVVKNVRINGVQPIMKHTIPTKSVELAVVKDVQLAGVQKPVDVEMKLTASVHKTVTLGSPSSDLEHKATTAKGNLGDNSPIILDVMNTEKDGHGDSEVIDMVENTTDALDTQESSTVATEGAKSLNLEGEADMADIVVLDENTVVPEERSGFPATYVFNRAFTLGLRSGFEACTETFGECPMNVDQIVRFGSNLFTLPLSLSDEN